jgi:hypothetical protein
MKRAVLWWIPAIAVATLALAEGTMRSRAPLAHPPCATELTMDVGGNGGLANVVLERVGDDAWVDVLIGGDIVSTTRVGAWRDGASLEAVDADGDGKMDLVRRYSDHGRPVADVWISDGQAFEQGWQGASEARCVAQR